MKTYRSQSRLRLRHRVAGLAQARPLRWAVRAAMPQQPREQTRTSRSKKKKKHSTKWRQRSGRQRENEGKGDRKERKEGVPRGKEEMRNVWRNKQGGTERGQLQISHSARRAKVERTYSNSASARQLLGDTDQVQRTFREASWEKPLGVGQRNPTPRGHILLCA